MKPILTRHQVSLVEIHICMYKMIKNYIYICISRKAGQELNLQLIVIGKFHILLILHYTLQYIGRTNTDGGIERAMLDRF